jgi:hypothetical protein
MTLKDSKTKKLYTNVVRQIGQKAGQTFSVEKLLNKKAKIITLDPNKKKNK